MTGQQSQPDPSGGNIQFEVGRLTGENTRLHLENTRLREELTRLTDENVRLREENARFDAEVKRLTEDPPPPLSPDHLVSPQPVKRYIYKVNGSYVFSTVKDKDFFLFGRSYMSYYRVRTLQGSFLLANEVSPQGSEAWYSELTFDWKIIDIPGLTFLREVSYSI